MVRRWVFAWLGVVLLGGAAHAQSVTPVPALDLNKLTGSWYKLADYPEKAERKCKDDALVLFSLTDKPNHFAEVDSCRVADEYRNVRNRSGRKADKLGDGRLKISYFVFLSHKEWVVGLAPDYSWAIVATPNHKVVWVLSRSITLPDSTLTEIKGKLTAQGFDPAKLRTWTQGEPVHAVKQVVPTGGAGLGGVTKP